jgi:hypothetical protein
VPKIALVRKVASLDVAERGRLMDAAEIAASVFSGKVGKKWVFANVPVHYRHKVGRLVLYYEGEVRAWVESLREVA